jgi:hypothetical protein
MSQNQRMTYLGVNAWNLGGDADLNARFPSHRRLVLLAPDAPPITTGTRHSAMKGPASQLASYDNVPVVIFHDAVQDDELLALSILTRLAGR